MSLDALHRGFRAGYLPYAELEAQLQAWAHAYPSLCRVTSLGTTREGRSLWLATIGPEPERVRPAVWVNANLHAAELAGSSVALAIAEDLLRLHLEGELHQLPRPITEQLGRVLCHVAPRVSPDGAEHVLDTGRFVRSVPRDDSLARGRARWRSRDVDGDGLSLLMRVEDPGGEFVESRELAGLMLERRIDDPGPYYKLYPEGVIEPFDGRTIPDPDFLGDNPIDLNRNFPWSWAPAHEQAGAGPFAASEPESRAIIEFATRHPEIFAWLDLHTFGGVAIRPLGNAPDTKMPASDLALFRQIEQWTSELTGYPMVSGYEEFLYEPDKPLHGDLTDYAYHQRGAIAYVVELWDLFARLGLPRPKRFVDYYSRLARQDLLRLARWDESVNHKRVFRPWRPALHPQLGPVEVGGFDPRVGIWNPPEHELATLCERQSQAFLRVAALGPTLVFESVASSAAGGGASQIDVCVANHGYLPTHVLASARALDFNEPLSAELLLDGPVLLAPMVNPVRLGHLQGWGRGLYQHSVHYPRSTGSGHRAQLRYLVRGSGSVRLRVGGCRTGWIETTLRV